ncbi:flagellar M-ring protein FliF, partial [Octadecabacter sp.]|nr:flagellar M-ring protein FliF [Octadecabacter sp.]
MSNIESVWTNLNGRRKVTAVGAALAVFAAVFLISRNTNSTDMSLLYAGLDNGASGEVITTLDQLGVAYNVQGASIFVPTIERDRLRMTLASEGLPANSAQGYELLDSLSG